MSNDVGYDERRCREHSDDWVSACHGCGQYACVKCENEVRPGKAVCPHCGVLWHEQPWAVAPKPWTPPVAE